MPNWVTNTVTISRTPATTVSLEDIATALNTNDRDEVIATLKDKIANPAKRDGWESEKWLKDELKHALKRSRAEFDKVFDFNAIVPMPKDSDTFKAVGSLSIEDRQKFGADNWYDWSCQNWGTKWNATEAYADHTKNQLVYGFDTAWATPEPVIQALSEKYHVAVKCDYYDEDFGNNIGTYTYVNGELVSQENMTEQWERIAEYFGEDVMEDHGMTKKDGKWVYEEE